VRPACSLQLAASAVPSRTSRRRHTQHRRPHTQRRPLAEGEHSGEKRWRRCDAASAHTWIGRTWRWARERPFQRTRMAMRPPHRRTKMQGGCCVAEAPCRGRGQRSDDRDPKMRASEICPPTRSLARLAPQPSPDNQAAPPALQGGRAVAATRTRVNDTPATNSAASSRRQHHEAHRPHLSSWFEPWLV